MLQFTAATNAGREADLGHKQSLPMQMAYIEGGWVSVDQPSPRPLMTYQIGLSL